MSFLEVRIPISPRPDFFNRVRIIAHSIRSLGPRYVDVTIRVTVGADQEPFDLWAAHPWSRPLGIDWVWVDRAEFNSWEDTRNPYIATMMERFKPPFGGDNVLMLDADVIAIRPFDEMIDFVNAGSGGIGGVMAHGSPFAAGSDEATWSLLYQGCGLGRPTFSHELSGWTAWGRSRYPPPYYNTGVICAPASVLANFHDRYLAALRFVRSRLDNYFFEQIALTLALDKTPNLLSPLPLRYNFPNQPEFDTANPVELANVCFLHFLRGEIVSRERDLLDHDAMKNLVGRRDLVGSNEIFRQRIEKLLPLVEKEP